MAEPMKADQFARRLLYLNGQGGSSQEFWSSAAELTKAFEREAELMLRLRKRYDPNYTGPR